MKWLITANTNKCRIYECNHALDELKLIKTIERPENKLKTSDVVSDRQGRYNTSGPSRGTFEQPTDPEDNLVDNFARELACDLEKERNQGHYDELLVVMPAQMDGLLNHHLNQNVKALIKHDIHKNIMRLSEPQLIDFLHHNLEKH